MPTSSKSKTSTLQKFFVRNVIKDRTIQDQHYGFAIGPDGEVAYIPRSVCLKHGLDEGSSGLQFRSMTMSTSREDGFRQISEPIIWAEDIDIDKIAEAHNEVAAAAALFDIAQAGLSRALEQLSFALNPK